MTGSPAARQYRCSEGEIEIAVGNAEQWHALAVSIGRPELAYPGAWDAVKAASEDGPLANALAMMFAEDSADTWRRRLEAHGVPCRAESRNLSSRADQ
jgi:crotonobetainyl-CoA:carnitine CoA-transferase CaiB-like acyl-CoA transferase